VFSRLSSVNAMVFEMSGETVIHLTHLIELHILEQSTGTWTTLCEQRSLEQSIKSGKGKTFLCLIKHHSMKAYLLLN